MPVTRGRILAGSAFLIALAVAVAIVANLHHASGVCGNGLLVPTDDARTIRLEPGSRKLACGNPARIVITGDPVAVTSAYAKQVGCIRRGEFGPPGGFLCAERTRYRFTLDGWAGNGDVIYRAYHNPTTGRWEAEITTTGG